jgi:hypothetical protein
MKFSRMSRSWWNCLISMENPATISPLPRVSTFSQVHQPFSLLSTTPLPNSTNKQSRRSSATVTLWFVMRLLLNLTGLFVALVALVALTRSGISKVSNFARALFCTHEHEVVGECREDEDVPDMLKVGTFRDIFKSAPERVLSCLHIPNVDLVSTPCLK